MDKSSLSDKAIFLIISKAIQCAGSLILGIVLVRLLTKADYGTYLQVMLICTTVSFVLAFGMPQSIYYFLPQLEPNRKKTFLLQTLLSLFIIGLISSIICFLMRDYISGWMSNPSLLKLSLIFSAYLLFLLPDQCLEPTLISLGKTKLIAGINVIFSIAFIAFVLSPVLIGLDLAALFLSILIFYSLKFLFFLIYVLKVLKSPKEIIYDFKAFKSQVRYSFPLGLSSMVGMLSNRIDQFMISFWFSPAAFAVFARGAFELPLVNILPYTLSNLLLPKYVELHKSNNQKELLRLWHESVRRTALIILPVFVLTFVVAEKLITLLFTSGYSGSVIIFRIYLFLLPLRLTAYGSILRAVGDTKSVLRASMLFLISNIILNIIFYKIFGFVGPAVATIVAMNLNILYYFTKIQRTFNLKFFEILPWKNILKIGIASVTIGIVTYPVIFLNISKIAILFLAFITFAVLYFLVALRAKIFTPSDISLLKKWLRLKPLRLKP